MKTALLILIGAGCTPCFGARVPAASSANVASQAFQSAEAQWESCERPLREEAARRMALAGPGGRADLDSLGDCSQLARALDATIEGLPSASEKQAARAIVRRVQEQIESSAAAIFDGNNHE